MLFLWDLYICGLNSPALYQLSYRGINLVLTNKKCGVGVTPKKGLCPQF